MRENIPTYNISIQVPYEEVTFTVHKAHAHIFPCKHILPAYIPINTHHAIHHLNDDVCCSGII